MSGRNTVSTAQLTEFTNTSTKTINKRLNALISKNIVIVNGKKKSPNVTYSIDVL